MAQRQRGPTSGLGVTKYQDRTFSEIDQLRLTDEPIADDWRLELPDAKHNVPGDVADIRARHNAGS